MLTFFRTIFKSKIGAALALALLVVIAIAFASGDIAGMRGSSAGDGSSVATVGDESIDANELARAANSALDRVKSREPTATMKLLVSQGGLEQVLDELIDRTALFVFGKDHGVVAGDRLVDSEITQIQAFQGVDGQFDQDAFRQALAQQGISEPALRNDIAQGLVVQQLLAPAQFATVMPAFAAKRYAGLLDETRKGSVVALPSILFVPEKKPDDKALQAFYKAHTDQFIRPERRVIRYATFGEEAIKAPPPPTDAEIAARYKANAARYAAKDDRKITQLIVPTEAAARAVIDEVNGGTSLEAAARAKGLDAAGLEFFSREQLATQFSQAVADAVFAAPAGKLAAPARSALGWHVVRVDEEQKVPAKTLAEVKDELVAEIVEAKRRSAFTDLLASIEDQFADGANLVEVARSIGATVEKTPPIIADGSVYMKPESPLPEGLKALVSTAFAMEQEEPQVTQMGQGQNFAAGRPYVIYDVTEITPSAPAPLKEIENDVKLAWALDAGSKAAKAAAIKMQAEMRKGKTLAQAMAGVGKQLPPVQNVAMSRQSLTQALQQGRQIPPPVSLMFHMAEKTVKVQSAGKDRGWFVVELNSITPANVESAEMVRSAQTELGNQLGDAYADAFAKAVRKTVTVKKNDATIKALRDRLSGVASAN